MTHRYSKPEHILEEEQSRVPAPVKSTAICPGGFRYTVLGQGVAAGALQDFAHIRPPRANGHRGNE